MAAAIAICMNNTKRISIMLTTAGQEELDDLWFATEDLERWHNQCACAISLTVALAILRHDNGTNFLIVTSVAM